MAKIIGKLVGAWWNQKNVNCQSCSTIIELEESDVIYAENDYRNETLYSIECLTSGMKIYFYKDRG